jgi:hypothetical protein
MGNSHLSVHKVNYNDVNNRQDATTFSFINLLESDSSIQKLLVFERKILRKIFGPTREKLIWRIKTNEELDKLIKHHNIINYIKAQRLSWFGHVQRMPDSSNVKKIYKWTTLTTRSKGRPNQRWEDNITQDIHQMNIKSWAACVQDRATWKNIVEKAKTFKGGG